MGGVPFDPLVLEVGVLAALQRFSSALICSSSMKTRLKQCASWRQLGDWAVPGRGLASRRSQAGVPRSSISYFIASDWEVLLAITQNSAKYSAYD